VAVPAITFQKQLQQKVDSLSGAEKRLAQYILNDNTAAVLTTTGDLARAVGISESTVVRFAQSLGFKGFPDMKRALQKELRSHLRAASRMEETIAAIDKHGAEPGEDVIIKLIRRDIQLLNETLRALSVREFHKAVARLWRARRVFIIGLNASMALACFMQFRLVRLKKDVRWLSIPGGASLIDQLALLEKSDALIALGFVNIPRETQTAIQYAKKIGCFVFGITDLPTSFIAREADICLYAKRGLHTTVNTLVPAFSLVNALTIALGQAKSSDSIRALKDLDDLYETYLK